MQLLYLVFGNNIQNHFQANFSILSFLRQKENLLTAITIVTDAPEFYQHLGPLVTTEVIAADTLLEWQGEYRFFWRAKIKALEYAAQRHPQAALLYLDTDTFLHGSLPQLAQALATGTAFMHEAEGALSSLPSKTERRMWQQVKGQTFGGVAMQEKLGMWNAGVVGIPAQRNLEAIALALRICDDLCAQQVTPRLIEQFALSVALEETYTLEEARPHIGHYWSTKTEWNGAISAFLLESHLKNRTLEADLAALSAFDYQQLPIKKKVRNTQNRLNNLVNKAFPPRQVEFIDPKR
ncbi:hypothetical protein [Hymenobacter cavernae]|uniref:Nucleotide-diphospho-sugar transferase domain-containing protein n=1 Tax=Hymenobacter cavernae TaxID=2044852 RepID=A0ABQ1UC70_9BACT|nr:hypothetical protein [Hymenobacter cavernae]GGF15607.1 hypothetical protein GCM10011383_28620 [Hymenobacter cavernae]